MTARALAVLLVVTLVYSDLSHLPLLGPLFTSWAPQPVSAAAGEYSVYRNAADTTTLTTTPVAVPWDTIVNEAGSIARQAGNTDVDLSEGGKYLVLYNVWSDTGGSTGGDRRELDTYVAVNSVTQPYGFSTGYVRDSGGEDVAAYNAGAAILDVSAGDDLSVRAVRTDANTGAALNVRAGTNGLQIVKLNDTYDYLRVQQTAGVTDISGYTSFTDVPFNQADEVDTTNFSFTASSTATDMTLKGAAGQKFLVTANVKISQTANSADRQNYEMRLVRDGVEIPGTRTTAYPRGAANGHDIFGGTLNYVGVIDKQTSSDEVIRVQVRREGQGSATTAIVGGETALAAVALPVDVPAVGLTYGGTGQTLAVSQTPLTWDTQSFIDSGTFSHSTSTNSSRITIDTAGDYLFFSSAYTSRTSNTDRNVPRIDWRLDGTTVVAYGGHGSFNRGDQGTTDAYTGGSAGGVLLSGVSAGQYLEVVHSDETGDSPNAVFAADHIAVQGISLAALSSVDVLVAAVSGQDTTVSPNTSSFFTGLQFSVAEQSSARNVTSITINETGTVDAQQALDNIAVYYDLDTTAPYNCVGESYGGGESQFGATDTDGFTGANGISSFVDSVSISATQTLCGYVVLDVAADAVNGQTINLSIADPSSDVAVTGGGVVSPGTALLDDTVTTVTDPEATQFGYHWRDDNGSETTASSATAGVENTPLLSVDTVTPQRLRLGVYNAGTGTTSQQYRLQYAEKAGTCEAASSWYTVGTAGGAWDLFDSSNLTNSNNTTNLPVADGGLTDPVATFVATNGGVRDTTATTGVITLGTLVENIISEYDTISVTNGSAQTISLDNTYDNPVVAVSVRYSRSTDTARTPRVVSKASTSFDVLIDNFDSSLTGTTQIDYVVLEAGEHVLPDSGLRVYAATTSVSTVAARTIPTSPGGTVVTWPTVFDTQPAVFATVSSNNDPDWIFASAYDGTAVANPPTDSSATVFLNENFESDGHTAAETVDIIAFEPGTDTNNGIDLVWQQTGSTIVSTPSTVTFTSAYSSTPAVVLAYHPTNDGSDGGFTQVDTDTPPTSTGVTISVDEDGTAADRGHAGTETASVVSFAGAGDLISADSQLLQSFVELEYSLIATANAVEGVGYCFRVSDAGTPLRNYTEYPEATLNADVSVSTLGSQISNVDAGTSDVYVGGAIRIVSNSGTHAVSSFTLSEAGTIDAAASISAVQLAVENDTSNPYDCASETYDGGEATYSGTAFSGVNGTSTFSNIGTTSVNSALCAYVLVDVADAASNGETIDLVVQNPNVDVVAGGASVGPGVPVALTGSTTVNAAAFTQSGYHWRADNGDETTASSTTGGSENTPLPDIPPHTTQRLRLAVSNDGAATSTPTSLRLEYGVKVTTCENVSGWQRVNDGAAFVMATTSQLVEGGNTTAGVAVGDGGVTDPNSSFLTPNGGQREISDQTSALTIGPTEFVELEFALRTTDQAAYDTTYCLRTTASGTPLTTYDAYAELTTRPQQDFFVQRGTEMMSTQNVTLTAGVDYTAPAATSSAFVRITNTHHTGAGGPAGSNDPPSDTSAYIEVTDLTSSFTMSRPATFSGETYVAWEIVEYIGLAAADNEMIVRDVGTVTYGANSLYATGTAALSVADDADVVVFITGQRNPGTAVQDTNLGLSVSSWNATSSVPVFERGDADGVAAELSYAVVEFSGANWKVQRIAHTYDAAGVFETESITPVTAVTQTFLHTQKLSGDELFNLDETGHEVYLSGMGTVSFELQSGATNPNQQRSVAWVIENMQTGDGALRVYRSDGTISSGGGDNTTFVLPIGLPAEETLLMSNASIYINNQSTGAGSAHPRAYLGATIASSTDYTLYRSDDGQNQDYRVAVVEWPVAELSLRQNYYRLYVDNDTLEPTDPWPVGASDLGENESMTDLDQPLGLGERVRVRMSLLINNASLVPDSKQFTLQYGRRVTSCNAVNSWSEVGAPGSGDIWRGYDASPSDGATISSSTLLLSVSEQPGTYEEANDSAFNPVLVDIGEDVEYDWLLENNGALQKSSYCFRIVEAGGAELAGYDFYPTVRTSGYTPVVSNWRWYTDVASTTPTTPAANEQVAITNVDVGETLKLRVAVTETEGASGDNIKFNLAYSEYSDFRDGGTQLTASTTCTGGTYWCYADGGGVDNEFVPSVVLSGVDSCVAGVGDGCGVHNEVAGLTSPFDHSAGATAEHEFTIQHDAALVNQVYYFRLVDATNGVPVVASSSYPSIQTAGSDFTFTVTGVAAGTSTEGVVTDTQTQPEQLYFSDIPLDTPQEAAHRLRVTTNATGGYRVYLRAQQPMQSSSGEVIPNVAASNTAPVSWDSVCPVGTSCFGYHAGDDSLSGDSTRFAVDTTYAGLPVGTYDEVMYNNLPHDDVQDVVYRVQIDLLQAAGSYVSNLEYVAVPSF